MRARTLLVASALVVAAGLATSDARAAAPVPLSTLAALPAAAPIKAAADGAAKVPGVSVKTRDAFRGTQWHDLTSASARGYCFATNDPGLRWTDTYGIGSRSDAEELDLDRLVESDGKATFERTRIAIDPKTGAVVAKARSSAPLVEVARSNDGVVVWGLKDDKDVVLLARRADRGIEARRPASDDSGVFPFVSADGCPFAGVRLDGKKPEAGSFAQLAGDLPARGTGKEKTVPRFVVDASLLKMTRDPEPVLSVRIRVRERQPD